MKRRRASVLLVVLVSWVGTLARAPAAPRTGSTFTALSPAAVAGVTVNSPLDAPQSPLNARLGANDDASGDQSITQGLRLVGKGSLSEGSLSESAATLSIQPASRLAVPGQVFTLTLAISGASNAAAFETTVSYDPNILQVLAITHPAPSFFAVNGRSTGRPPAEPQINFALGRMTIGEYSFGGVPVGRNGNGTLALIRFQALVLGATFLTFSHDPAYLTELLDPYGNPLMTSTTDGLVQVVPEQHVYLPMIRR